GEVQTVLDQVPGQDAAMTFLRGAAERPHHAYVFAGPEGSGKSLAARAFAASLLCANGGCGECRDCRLALRDQHPNEFVVEPEGRDIHVDTVRDEVWHPAYLTAPEPGRKVFLLREADRLSPSAADTLLKVLEEPPADAVFLLLSARAHELPETIWSRCHIVTFTALSEPFVDEKGRPEEAYRGSIRRIETRFHRRERRAERDHLDRVLMAASALLRDSVAAGTGVSARALLNPDRKAAEEGSATKAVAGLAAMEEARAALADDVNLNPRLVVERAFLQL